MNQCRTIPLLRICGIAFATLALSSVAHAQSSESSLRANILPTRWEASVVPTVQKFSSRLTGDHVWGGGLAFGATFRATRLIGVDAVIVGTSAPQLNYRTSAVLNSVATFVSAEGHLPREMRWEPYASLGLGVQRFKYQDAPAGIPSHRTYGSLRGALGVRYAITPRVNYRGEFNGQFGKFGGSPALSTGVTFRLGNRVVSK